jgi:hypothetical protein
MPSRLTQCFVDESIHEAAGFVVIAFVFASGRFERSVAQTLLHAGLDPKKQEFKSSARMDRNQPMRNARDALLDLAGSRTQIAVFFGPFDRSHLGKQSLQALQSVLVRNGMRPSRLSVYFDTDIFASVKEAARLHRLFHYLRACRLFAREDSRIRLGIQVADAVAHSFGQILKEALTGNQKFVDVGGARTGYPKGTEAPLGWLLLMTLRSAMLTRPSIYRGEPYSAASDPVVMDPERDDPVTYLQKPILLGWGVQVAPEADDTLRQAVEQVLGRVWLGCTR